jgi:hypothetical protein
MKDMNQQPEHHGAQEVAQQTAAFLSYALADVRKVSPLSAYFLEMAIIVLSDDTRENETNGVPTTQN